ncbi:MAG: glutaredoxin family protein [Patescibacteria group bacterium]
MQITVYTTGGCPYCLMLKDYLNSKSITFTEKLVDQDETAKKEMLEISNGFMGVPFSVFTKDDGEKETVIGFDKGKINEILQLT